MNDTVMNYRFLTIIFVFVLSFFMGWALPNPAAATSQGLAVDDEEWPGFWFVCEFSQRQRAPNDGCKMFDDEGFQLAEGRLRYIRMLGSTESACRGNKKGQCFSASMPEIRISRTDRGKLSLGDKQFNVRYFGCTQVYYFADTLTYREIWPDKKRCFWASKRRFYIAPYKGSVTITN